MAVSQGGASAQSIAAIKKRTRSKLLRTRSYGSKRQGRFEDFRPVASTHVSPPTSRSMPCLPNRLRLEAIATHVRRSSARLHSTRRVEVTDHVAQFVKMNR